MELTKKEIRNSVLFLLKGEIVDSKHFKTLKSYYFSYFVYGVKLFIHYKKLKDI